MRKFIYLPCSKLICVVDPQAIKETSIVHHEWKAVLPEVIPAECRAGTRVVAGQILWIAKIDLVTGVLITGNNCISKPVLPNYFFIRYAIGHKNNIISACL